MSNDQFFTIARSVNNNSYNNGHLLLITAKKSPLTLQHNRVYTAQYTYIVIMIRLRKSSYRYFGSRKKGRYQFAVNPLIGNAS